MILNIVFTASNYIYNLHTTWKCLQYFAFVNQPYNVWTEVNWKKLGIFSLLTSTNGLVVISNSWQVIC